MRTRGWRRIGTVIVRWPGPILVVSIALAADRPARPAGIQDQLRRPPVPARHRACQRRICGRRTALLRGPAQSRTADDRVRSRHAQPVGHAHPRARRQGGPAHPRHRAGAVDHPATGHADHAQLHTVSDQRDQCQPDHEPQLPAGQGPGHPEAGRPDQQVDRHPASSSSRCRRPAPPPPTSRPRRSTTPSRRSTSCATTSPTSTTSSGPCATTSTGSRTASTSPSCAALRSVFDSLDGISAAHRPVRRRSRRVWTSSMPCSRNWSR